MYNRWNTLGNLDQLRNEIDQIFHSFSSPVLNQKKLAFLPGYSARNYPLMNLSENNDHFFVEALAPGIDPEKLNISITGNVLTLSGEKMRITEDIKPESFHRSERASGKFVRTIELPSNVKQDNIDAQYKNGVLYITLPKVEEAKTKLIQVRVN